MISQQPNARVQSQGQGLMEYSLLGGLLVVLGIGAAILLGNNVLEVFASMVASDSKTGMAVTAKSTSSSTTTGTTSTSVAGITLSNGTYLSLPNYPADTAKAVVTTGVNGVTNMLATTIQDLSNQLQASGNLTPEQARQLIALANQGHKIAEIEKIVEDAVANSNNDPAAFLSTSLTHAGQTYASPLDLAERIGYNTPSETEYVATDNETSAFMDMYQQLVNSGALADPQVQAVIGELVNQINVVADSVNSHVYKIEDGIIPPADFQSHVAADTDAAIPGSLVTDGYSSAICTVGGTTDTGTHCTE